MNKIETLKNNYKKSQEDEKFLMTKLSNNEEKRFFIGSLEFVNINYALYNIFIKSMPDGARLAFYNASMIAAYLHEKYNEDIFLIKFFTYPVLSDNSNLMDRFSRYNNSRWGNTFAYYYGKAVQSVIINNKSNLAENIKGLEKTCKKGWEKQYSGFITAFQGFLDGSPELIIRGVEELLTKYKKQDIDELLKEFINLEATAILKLSLRQNMELKINNPLIPNEFLLIKELPEYKGYDFFKEIE